MTIAERMLRNLKINLARKGLRIVKGPFHVQLTGDVLPPYWKSRRHSR